MIRALPLRADLIGEDAPIDLQPTLPRRKRNLTTCTTCCNGSSRHKAETKNTHSTCGNSPVQRAVASSTTLIGGSIRRCTPISAPRDMAANDSLIGRQVLHRGSHPETDEIRGRGNESVGWSSMASSRAGLRRPKASGLAHLDHTLVGGRSIAVERAFPMIRRRRVLARMHDPIGSHWRRMVWRNGGRRSSLLQEQAAEHRSPRN